MRGRCISYTFIIALTLPAFVKARFFFWKPFPQNVDDVKEDWPLFMAKYCGRMCQNGELVVTPSYCTMPECFPCTCNEYCNKTGTCCPTVDASGEQGSYNLPQMADLESFHSEVHARVDCHEIAGKHMGLIVSVAKCPGNWTDEDVREKCENPKKDSFDSVTPYLEKLSGLVFANMFCAVCNVFWSEVASGNVHIEPTGLVTPEFENIPVRRFKRYIGYDYGLSDPRIMVADVGWPNWRTSARSKSESFEKEVDESTEPFDSKIKSIFDMLTDRMSISDGQTKASSFQSSMNYQGVVMEPVSLRIGCKHYQNLYHINDAFEFYNTAKDLDECVYEFGGPGENNPLTKCRSKMDEITKTPSCDAQSDKTYQDLCHDLPPIPGLRVSKANNLFCFLCAKKTTRIMTREKCESEYPDQNLFNLHEYHEKSQDKESVLNCSSFLAGNDKVQCSSNVLCPAGKNFLQESITCKTFIDEVRGLRYTLNVTFVSESEFNPDDDEQYIYIWGTFNQVLSSPKSFYSIRFSKCTVEGGARLRVDIDGYFEGLETISRDAFESEIVDTLANKTWSVPLELGSDALVLKMDLVCMGHDLCAMYRDKSRSKEACDHVVDWTIGDSMNLKQSTNYLELTPSLACPSVPFDLMDASYAENHLLVLGFDLKNETTRVPWNGAISIVDGQLRLCADYLQQLINSGNNTVSKRNGYLYVLCISMSYIVMKLFRKQQ